MSILSRATEIEREFYHLKAQEWACEPKEAEEKISEALGVVHAEFVVRRSELSEDELTCLLKQAARV